MGADRTSSVRRNALLAVLQVTISGVALFLTFRVLLDVVGPEALGAWSLVLSVSSGARLSELGLSGGATRFVATALARGDESLAALTVETTLISTGILLVAAVLLGLQLVNTGLALALPTDAFSTVADTIPLALSGMVAAGLAAVVQGALDGCHRADLRAIVSVVVQLLSLPMTVMLAYGYGIWGVALAQLASSCLLLVLSWAFLRRQLGSLGLIPHRWNRAVFRSTLVYGAGLQVSTVSGTLVDPLVKGMLIRFGTLESAAFYDMAHRLVLQLRGLVVSANQVLVPIFSKMSATSSEEAMSTLYRRATLLVEQTAAPLLCAACVAAPSIGLLWIGSAEPTFDFFVVALALAYFLNALSAPAYFLHAGIGRLRWNQLSHVTQLFTTASFSVALGPIWGLRGVGIAAALGISMGSAATVYGLHRSGLVSSARTIGQHHLSFNCALVLIFIQAFRFMLSTSNNATAQHALSLLGLSAVLAITLRSSLRDELRALVRT